MGPAEFTVAVMEGVAFSAKLSMEALQKSADAVKELVDKLKI